MSNLEYETKCRKCGTANKWHSAILTKNNENHKTEFNRKMVESMMVPSFLYCENCQVRTVQDLTWFTDVLPEN